MASKHGYYSVEEYTKQKQHQETGSRIPPRANILAAANHIRDMFESKKFLYGVFGGLAMLSLGCRREQPDLHFAYDDKDFHRIKAKLEGDKRIRLPDGMNSLFPAKILIRTGPSYKDEGCAHAAEIALDLVPPGSNGTPTAGMLSTNLVLLTLKSEKGKPITYKGLNLPHLIKTSVYYSGITGLSWDPRKDILFLCQTYGGELSAARHQFDQRAAQQNFLGTPFFSRLSPQEQRVCYQVLLGKEPLPTMAITPPALPTGHKHSASASSVDPRPRLASYKSTPTLQSGNQAGLLSPPLPAKNPHKRSASAEARPTELPASTEIHHQAGSQDHNRDSRSRYRPISAPTSREGSPREGQLGLKPGQPMPQMQQHILNNHAHHRMSFLPQPPMSMGPVPVGPNARRSMQNMNSNFNGPVPAFAFAQTPMLNGFNHEQPIPAGVAEMSATPAPVNPGQHHLKSQAGLAGSVAPRPQHVQGPINERLPPHQTRASYHAPPAFMAELSSTPAPGARTHDHKVNIISELPASSPATKGQDPSKHTDAVELSAVEYRMPSKPRLETSSAPSAVELDAISPIGHFIAELSVDRTTPAPNHIPKMQQTPHDSPISPPVNHTTPAPITHTDIPIRPLNPRTHSAPLSALPSSLMAGGPKAHTRVPSETASPPPTDTTIQGTNASRYTQLSHPTTPPSQPSTYQAYQAYHPPSQSTHPRSAHADTQTPEANSRPLSFAALKDVDGASHYFKAHRRDASHGSRASSTSCDSRELAAEYRAAMPEFGGGYVGGEGAVDYLQRHVEMKL